MADNENVTLREKVVTYIGLSDVRVIYKTDQKYLGIEEAEEDVVWDRQNHWTIPANSLPSEILRYCEHDREFVIKTQ